MAREAIIIVRDPSVAGFSDLLERIAQSETPVLIHGEIGAGKEVLARSLHAVSQRPGELVVVNCAAKSASQLERELFGYESKAGVFESKGTVLLEEIGEMPREVQSQLLHALELREVRRVGSSAPAPFAARVMATSHHVFVTSNPLRDELLRRLNGITLELLPLRERRNEIVGLAQELLVEAVRETAFPTTRFTASALTTLMQYDWPGNVRELRLVVSRAALLAGAAPIESHHLLLDTRGSKGRLDEVVPAAPDFVAVAREHHGNASAIARALHTSRSQVRRLASRFEVDLDQLRRALRE
ncbi:MAG: sigma 54-interacting transcriptional regulator [Kofleriaceae bacterium]